MKNLVAEIEKVKNRRISLDDAPIHYSNSEASAWLDGYLTAVEEIVEILKVKSGRKEGASVCT